MDEEEKMPLDKKDVEEKEYLNKQLNEMQQRVEELLKDAMKWNKYEAKLSMLFDKEIIDEESDIKNN